jgi:signal peptidase I
MQQTKNRTAGRRILQALWEVISTVVPAIVIALAINTYVAQASTVDGPSMQPNLYSNYRVMAEKVTYRFFHGPRRGDVVIVNVPGEEIPLIKRVIALAGETIEARGGQTFIDGQPLDEPWVTYHGGGDYGPLTVPPLHVFIMGDNRPSSRDSRAFGPVHVDQIVGHALFIYWPPAQAKSLQ